MAITNDGGSYNLENIKTGMYRLTAEAGISLIVANVLKAFSSNDLITNLQNNWVSIV